MAKRKRKRAKRKNPPVAKRRHKKRAHARKRAANPRKRRRAKRRHTATNPRRRTSRRRARRANPKRRHRVSHARRVRSNPRRRHSSKRRHRRNPGIPSWAMAGLAGVVGLGSFALATSAAFGLTKRMDPALTTLQRNRYIVGGAFTAAGLLLAHFASPIFGAAVAAGGLAELAGAQLSLAIDPVFQLGAAPAATASAAPATTTTAQKTNGLGAIVGRNGRQMFGMGAIVNGQSGQQRFGAVFNGQHQILIGGVADQQDYFGG